MKTNSKLVHLGRSPETNDGVVNPPVNHTSTILFETLEAFEAAKKGQGTRAQYGRFGSSTHRAFEKTLAELEGACGALLCPSGVSALTTAYLALVKAGDHMLVSDSAYEPTRFFADQVLAPMGIEVSYFTAADIDDFKACLKPNTSLVVLESPGSLTFDIQDIPTIAAAAHNQGALVLVDSTYSSPLLMDAYALGADLTVYSASKYVCGHSDVMMGVITAKAEVVFKRIKKMHAMLGVCTAPDDIYLVQRGLRTLAPRLKHHEAAAIEVAKWLEQQPEVAAVLHPALPSHPQHALWKRDFKGSNGLFSIVLQPSSRAAVAAMLDSMHYFKMGFSWGGYESLVIPFSLQGIRKTFPYSHTGQGLRLHIGLEDVEDLKADLRAGLDRFSKAA